MADYSVDIAVAVKGSQQLKKLRTEISNTSKELTVLNKLANKQSKTLPNSFQTLNKLVKQVKNNFDANDILIKKRVRYKVNPIGIKTTTPAIK